MSAPAVVSAVIAPDGLSECPGRKPGRGHYFVPRGGGYGCAFCPRRLPDVGPPDPDRAHDERGIDFGDPLLDSYDMEVR